MPLYLINAHFMRTSLREAWTEVEADDLATAIEKAKEEDAAGDLDWRENNSGYSDSEKVFEADEIEIKNPVRS